MYKNDRLIWQRERQRDYRICELLRKKLAESDTVTFTRAELDEIYAQHGSTFDPKEYK